MYEEEIRPAALMAAKKDSVKADIAFLIDQKNRWIDVVCPSCSEAAGSNFGEKDGFEFDLCATCGTVFTNPRPNLEVLHQFYENSLNYKFWNEHIFPATEQVRREKIVKPRAKRVVNDLLKIGLEKFTLVEVGAAYGWFCEEIQALSPHSTVIAVEPSRSLAETCVRKGINTKNSPIEKLLLDEQVDVVAAFEVIEHIFSPKDFIGHTERILKPGGTLFLSCPNLNGFDIMVPGTESSAFQHEHLNYFTPTSLTLLLQSNGFSKVRVSTPGELDVDIVRKSWESDPAALSKNQFIAQILNQSDPALEKALQMFLAENRLSSHMWVMATKDNL